MAKPSAARRMGLRLRHTRKHQPASKLCLNSKTGWTSADFFNFGCAHVCYDAQRHFLQAKDYEKAALYDSYKCHFAELVPACPTRAKKNRVHKGYSFLSFLPDKRHCYNSFGSSPHTKKVYAAMQSLPTGPRRRAIAVMVYCGANFLPLVEPLLKVIADAKNYLAWALRWPHCGAGVRDCSEYLYGEATRVG